MRRLPKSRYLSFPFRVGREVAQTSNGPAHVREQIMQVLFTGPGERVFRPEFGAGVRSLLFEPNAPLVWELTRKRLIAALGDALKGEVDPGTIEVDVQGISDATGAVGESLLIRIAYQLAKIGVWQEQNFDIGAGSAANG